MLLKSQHHKLRHLVHPELTWYPNGQSALTGDLLTLFQALDRYFLNLSHGFQAKECRYGLFIHSKCLERIDYLHSFPQHATFALNLSDDKENLQAFQNSSFYQSDGTITLTQVDGPANILTPAACYHFYIHHQNSELQTPLYLTTMQQCFRRESEYKPLERQWCFSMREIVCIGSMEAVQRYLMTVREQVDTLLKALKLPVVWQAATDPFFDPSNNTKFFLQKIQPNKTEIVFNDRLAIGSLNFHRNYFGESFDIRYQGNPAMSACMAFGIERWIAAILHQFGPERRDWPQQELGMLSDGAEL